MATKKRSTSNKKSKSKSSAAGSSGLREVTPLDILRAYEGASKSRRTKNWRTSNTSANADSLVDLPTLRARARDLVRNNGYAFKAIEVLEGNIVGTGILLKVISEREAQRSRLQILWEQWAESTDCDADGLHDIYGLQALAVRSAMESGEVLIRRRWRRASDKLPIPFQLQILEADFIDTLKNETLPNGNLVVQGIEFNSLGRRVAYWLYPQHPGEAYYGALMESKRIPAEDIIHLFHVQRPGQVRGIPRGSCVILKLRDFDEVQDAFIILQKIAACFSVFITENDLDDRDLNEDDENDIPERVTPGMVSKLGPGQSVTFGNPPAVAGYKDFSSITLRNISVGYNVPNELLTNDFSQFSFSSSRMSWLGFDRDIERMRWLTVIPRLNKTSFKWFLEGAELMGHRTDGVASAWTPPRRQMIDPVAETRALNEAVRAGFMSLSEAIRQLGYDPKEVLEEKATDNELLDKLGLTLDSDPRRVTEFGMNQPQYGKGNGGDKDE